MINTASFVAVLGAATAQLAYTASKGGVLAMTRELALVHAREGSGSMSYVTGSTFLVDGGITTRPTGTR